MYIYINVLTIYIYTISMYSQRFVDHVSRRVASSSGRLRSHNGRHMFRLHGELLNESNESGQRTVSSPSTSWNSWISGANIVVNDG